MNTWKIALLKGAVASALSWGVSRAMWPNKREALKFAIMFGLINTAVSLTADYVVEKYAVPLIKPIQQPQV